MNEQTNRPGRSDENRHVSLAKFLEEKGFYIILFLCVAAIGIAGYVFFFADPTTVSPVSADVTDSADILANWTTAALPSLSDPDEDEEVFGRASTTKAAATSATSGTTAATSAATKPAAASTAATTGASTRAAVQTTTAAQATTTAAKSKAADFFVRPLPGEVLNPYSADELVYDRTNGDWRTHNGTDFAASDGDKVYAVADGTVADVYTDEFYGTSLLLDHGGGLQTVYTGLGATLTVKEGQEVSAGDVLGMLEASILFESAQPVHLHLEMLQDGQRIDPMSLIPG
ncbi:MAG: M23 family metallopeptidase [Ruminococcaceae bacterium]|nr:M23 family metallopeptidase [Oscillospiraceae bacterium]